MANSSNHGEGTSSTSQTEPPPPPPPVIAPPSHKYPDSTSSPPPPTTSYPNHPPYPPPYGPYYPPAGYPNPNHHAYPQGYATYTNTYPNGYPNGYPPTDPYYGHSASYPTAGTPAGTRASSRCVRSFILCCCMTFLFIFLASLVVSLALRPQLPVYKVVSMSVTNFTTTPSLAGEWNTKVMVENTNDKLRALFSDFKVNIIYKDGVVAVNYAPGFVMEKKEVREMEVKGWSSHANEEMLEKETKDDLVKERATGSITFALRLATVNAFKSGSFSTKNLDVAAICEGLKVVFPGNNATTGTLDNGGKPIECLTYV